MITDNDIIKLILAFKIKHLRSKQQLSYHELASISGLSVSYLNDIEKGKKYPKPDKIRALATAFNVDYNELVSTKADKKLLPVIELLNSGFFKHFPASEFGFDMEKLIDFFSNSPDRISAFISTILKMVRSYQIDKEDFYRVALRSYQDMHDNFFPELEEATKAFRHKHTINENVPSKASLIKILKAEYNYGIDYEALPKNKKLVSFRSYVNPIKKVIYLNANLTLEQERFLLAKELGFQFLQLSERPFETVLNKEASFEKLLNNYKASYFAAALLINSESIVEDINIMSVATEWKPTLITSLLEKYKVTAETFLQRLTNILPHFFKLNDLFFIRVEGSTNMIDYRISKELHLSGLQKPYQNQLLEHLCHRWVSISSIKSLHYHKDPHIIDAQISSYWQTDNAYFCISIAQANGFNESIGSSVTLGISMSENLRGTFNFIKDPNLRKRMVHTTCERCSIPDCEHRVAPPTVVDRAIRETELETELGLLL